MTRRQRFGAFFRQGTPESMARLVAFLYAIAALLLACAIALVAILEPNGEHAAGVIAALGVPFAAVVGGSWSALQSRVKQPNADAPPAAEPLAARDAVVGAGARGASD